MAHYTKGVPLFLGETRGFTDHDLFNESRRRFDAPASYDEYTPTSELQEDIRNAVEETRAVDRIVVTLNAIIHETKCHDTNSCIMHGVELLEQRLIKLYALEESNHILKIIHPGLTYEAYRLQLERYHIQKEVHRLVLAIESPLAGCDEALEGLTNDLRGLIDSILHHQHHEWKVLMDSADVDPGGEE